MTDAKIAALVKEVMDPEDRVERVTAGREGWAVDTRFDRWIVRQLPLADNAGYDLFDVAHDETSDPPGPSDGIAELADGRRFHLNDPAAARQFLSEVPYPGDTEVARTLALYQSGLRTSESVIQQPRDVFLPVDVQDALVLPDVHPPRRSEEMGGWTLRFFTQFLADDPDGQTKTHLRRWEVRWDASGHVSWTDRPALSRDPN